MSAPPRKLLWLPTALLLLVYLAVAAFTAGDYALSWDEPYRWRSGDLKRAYYERLLGGEDFSEAVKSAPRDTYPGLYDIPLSYARAAFPGRDIPLSRIWNAAFGLAALAATMALSWQGVRLARRCSGSGLDPAGWVEAWAPAVAGAALLCMPEFYGHMFINPKDVPFAAMHAASVVALIWVVSDFPRPSWGRCAAFGLAAGLAMGTRLPGGIVLAYFAAAAAVSCGGAAASQGAREGLRRAAGFLWRGLLAGAAALAALLPWWPAAHGNPFATQAKALGELHVRARELPLIFDGRLFEAGDTPIHYAVAIFAVKVPLWIQALLLAGAFFLARWLWSARPRLADLAREQLALGMLPLAFAFPFAYAVARQPAIHDGFRHLMFLLPLAAALAGISWWRLARAARASRLALPALCAATAGSVALVSVYLVRLHPYQYVYFNELIGGPAGAYGRYQTEYWSTATKAGVDFLKERLEGRQLERPVKLVVTGPWHVAEPYLDERFELTGSPAEADYFLGNTEMRADSFVQGEEIGRIERMGLPILIVKRLRSLEFDR